MPQELPTSQASLPVSQPLIPNPKVFVSSPNVSQALLQKEAEITAMCKSVLIPVSSSSIPHSTSSSAMSIDLVMVPSTTQSTTVTVAHIGPTTSTTHSKIDYKLSEIVAREQDFLFQGDRNLDIELEPARENVFAVRRRSHQFFTVLEEDENDWDDKNNPAGLAPFGESKVDGKTDKIGPVFNLGDSLKNLYFPDHHKKQRRRRKEHLARNKKADNAHKSGYESDPEGKIELCKAILDHPEFKRYKSHPELSPEELEGANSEVFEKRKSQSLPTTPHVSPKLKRRNSISNPEKQVEVQKSGPGFSFLESVAGQIHRRKQELDMKKEKSIVKKSDSRVTSPKPAQVPVIAEPSQEASVQTKEPSTEMHTHHVHDFSDSAGSDLETPKQYMKTIFNWTTNKKVNISNKESNMFSPSSF